MFWFELPVHFADDAITGTGAVTLAGVTSAGSGTATPPSFSGTGAVTLAGVSSAGGGVVPYAHYDASTLGLSNGATVTTWPDLSGNANDLAQTGGVTLPTYETNSQNGLGGVVFTGAQRIADVTLAGSPPATKTIFLVMKNPPNDGQVKYVTDNTTPFVAKWSNADRWIFGNSDTSFIEFTESGIVGVAGIWTFAHQQTGAFVRWDQTQKVSGNINAPTAPSNIILGTASAGGADFTAYEVIWYAGILSAADIDLVEDYLYEKWFAVGDITGTGATTLVGDTSAGTGEYTPSAITGTGTSTLGGVTATGSGTFTGAITGTGSSTLDGVTSTGSGTYTPQAVTGTGSSTLAGVTSAGTGTFLAAITGAGASTLDGVTSTGTGTFIPAIIGTGASTLQGVTSTGSGIFMSTVNVDNAACHVEAPMAVCGVEAPGAECRV